MQSLLVSYRPLAFSIRTRKRHHAAATTSARYLVVRPIVVPPGHNPSGIHGQPQRLAQKNAIAPKNKK